MLDVQNLLLIFLILCSFQSFAEINMRRCRRLYGRQLCKLQFARHRRSDFKNATINDRITKLVNEKCQQNADCITGAYCDAGSCRCFKSHIVIHEQCWKKIGPDESGCTYDEQCESVWPGSRCDFSVCRCPDGQITSVTREGTVCHYPGRCPTNGADAILYNRNSNQPSECYFYESSNEKKAGQFIGCDDFPEMYDCINGICCPTRAFTCIQPMDPGQPRSKYAMLVNVNLPVLEAEKRWFFNAATGSCVQFDYLGSEGNANNFLTKSHCETYCGNRCPRGQPLLDKTDFAPLSCVNFDDCGSDSYLCTKVSHQALCCPSPDFICSSHGGMLLGNSLFPFSAGSNRFGRKSQLRWYWDKEFKKCKTFKYLGQGGNFNNFPDEQSCIEFCSKALCPFGNPLLFENGMAANCTNNQHCPSTHYCLSTVCCPTATTVCNEPLALGTSCQTQPVPRYWFNSGLRVCQVFQYNGCHGNSNNFLNAEDCQRVCDQVEEIPRCPKGNPLKVDSENYWKCLPGISSSNTENQCPSTHECFFEGKTSACCPKKEFTCKEMADPGRKCNLGSSDRWYYDPVARSCKIFQFLGCDGNSNNFEDQSSCEDYCTAYSCPFGGNVLIKDNGEPLICHLSNSSKGCPTTHFCTNLLNAGANDDKNGYCCPTRQNICLNFPIDKGVPCTEPQLKYGYDTVLKACIPFRYHGCGGNANNFHNYQSCFHFCSSAACAPGEIARQKSINESTFDCTKQSCPSGFVCVADLIDSEKSICCGSVNMGLCPKKQVVYIEERTKKPKTCSGNLPKECPSDYSCVFNNERKKSFCCANRALKNVQCPIGLMPAENKKIQENMGCNTDAQCPAGSKCYKSQSKHQSGVCCLQASPCPPLYKLDVERSQMGECNPLEPTSCSANRNSICLFSEIMDRFVCCRREPKQPTELTVCPGRMVRDSKKRLCSSHGNCPSNYNCIRKNHERIGICCKHKKQQPVLKRKPIQSQCLFTEDICYADSERTIMNSHVNNFTNCPSGFMCINEKICCPNTWTLKLQVPQLCGDYWKPIMDNTNAFPIPCSPNEAICEAGQSCRFSAILRIHICCRPLFLLRNFNDSFQYDNQNMING